MYERFKIAVVIPAAGQGSRMRSDVSKQFIEIDDKPILAYTIEQFQSCSLIDDIIVVTGKSESEYVEKYIKQRYGFSKVRKIVHGGKERQHSVLNGLIAVDQNVDIVLIHDGARPLITHVDIEKVILQTIKSDACVLGVKVKDTVKLVDANNNVIETPDRKSLYIIQTPQGFKRELITAAYIKGNDVGFSATDDSMLVEKQMSVKVKVVEGNYQNIKITTPEDLVLVTNILQENGRIKGKKTY